MSENQATQEQFQITQEGGNPLDHTTPDHAAVWFKMKEGAETFAIARKIVDRHGVGWIFDEIDKRAEMLSGQKALGKN